MELADVEYFDWIEYPRARVRVEIAKQGGVPRRFVVQLERRVQHSWRTVVRFDHDPNTGMGHDVRKEGLHMDVYRDGRKYGVKDDFPAVSLTDAPRYCIAYLKEHANRLLRRFETWHELDQGPGNETNR